MSLSRVYKKTLIEVTDNLTIQFDQSQKNQVCAVLIRNNLRHKIILLDSITISLPSVKLCDVVVGQLVLNPLTEIKLYFEAVFVPNKFSDIAKVNFKFAPNLINVINVNRSIKIRYYQKGPIINKSLYDPPQNLNDLIASEQHISRSVLFDTLDQLIPSVDDMNYTTHFHTLFYLEEIGLRKEMKIKYNQKEAYFCDKETVHKNGKCLRRKYGHGIYDLEVPDLFETRPSLQIGDKIIARKHSSPTIPYAGELVAIKESDLICVKFKDDFIDTFENTAYLVDFDFSRTPWIRMHFALDLALDIFGIDYLNPKQFLKRNAALIDVHLNQTNQLQMENGTVLKWFNDSLNDGQKKTVTNVLRAELLNPYVIYGPPGTGKTTTLVEIILQLLTNIENCNILITTQSNSAANLILQRLIKCDQINTSNLLRFISFKYAQKDIVPDDIKDYTCTVDDLLPNAESNIYQRLSSAKRFRVVVGTSVTIAHMLESRDLRNHFTHAIIDEAGQSHELGVLVPMVLVGRNGQTILAGDPMQMPPIVINFHANMRGLNISMLSRLLDCYSNIEQSDDDMNENANISCLVSKLTLNYRSLPSILEFYNTQFYKSELIPMIDAKHSREAKLLDHISNSIFERPNNFGIYFINIDGQNIKRQNSYCNLREICVIEHLVYKLTRQLGFRDEAIGVITPYSMQQRQIEVKMKDFPNIKVGTVEDFQGLEREIILISTVRTCPGAMKIDIARFLGFVQCPKRINVAISRTRALVIVVGKGDLLSVDENWNALISRCKINGTFGNAVVEKCSAKDTLLLQKIEMINFLNDENIDQLTEQIPKHRQKLC